MYRGVLIQLISFCLALLLWMPCQIKAAASSIPNESDPTLLILHSAFFSSSPYNTRFYPNIIEFWRHDEAHNAVMLNGNFVLSIEPLVVDDVVYLPLRAIAENMGHEVIWNDGVRRIDVIGKGIMAKLYIDEDESIRIVEDISFIPMDLLGKHFNFTSAKYRFFPIAYPERNRYLLFITIESAFGGAERLSIEDMRRIIQQAVFDGNFKTHFWIFSDSESYWIGSHEKFTVDYLGDILHVGNLGRYYLFEIYEREIPGYLLVNEFTGEIFNLGLGGLGVTTAIERGLPWTLSREISKHR